MENKEKDVIIIDFQGKNSNIKYPGEVNVSKTYDKEKNITTIKVEKLESIQKTKPYTFDFETLYSETLRLYKLKYFYNPKYTEKIKFNMIPLPNIGCDCPFIGKYNLVGVNSDINDVIIGELCIFWNYDKKHAVVGILKEINFNCGFPYITQIGGNSFKNCIKYISKERYEEFLKNPDISDSIQKMLREINNNFTSTIDKIIIKSIEENLKINLSKCQDDLKERITKWYNQNNTFKSGDIIYGLDKYNKEYVSILDSKECNNIKAYCMLSIEIDFLYLDACIKLHDIRLATEEEKNKLFDKLKRKNLKWNAETNSIEIINIF